MSRLSRVTPRQRVVSTNSIGSSKCYWSGLDEAPSGTREGYRGALGHVNGDSPVAQTPLNVVEVGFQVADKQRRLAGRGYDGRVVRVECQLDVVRG